MRCTRSQHHPPISSLSFVLLLVTIGYRAAVHKQALPFGSASHIHSQIGRGVFNKVRENPLQAPVSFFCEIHRGGIVLCFHSQTLFTDLVIDKKIRPMALCAGL